MTDSTLIRPALRLRLPRRLWILLPLLVLATLFFYPLALIVKQAFTDDQGLFSAAALQQAFESRRFVGALLNTLQIALLATLGCLVLGTLLSLLLVFTPFPGSRLIARVIDTFIAMPTFLITLAFTFIYGSAGLLNGTLMATFGFTLPPVDFLYSIWGVILAGNHRVYPAGDAPADGGAVADRPQPARGRQHPRRPAGTGGAPGDFTGRAAGLAGRRQPVFVVDHQ